MSRFIQAPLNRIVRNPNYASSPLNPAFERGSVFLNSVKLLDDPLYNRKLILVGTLNSSTLLAERTKNLLELTKPDTVLVETDKHWFDEITSNLNQANPKTNEQIYNASQKPLFDFSKIQNNFRGVAFKSKVYPWAAIMKNALSPFTVNSSPFTPALETYRAVQYAKENDKKVIYTGNVFNPQVIQDLSLERRMYLLPLLYRVWTARHNLLWKRESASYNSMINVHGFADFSETVDDTVVNWYVKFFEKLSPYQKRIFIDREDERLFYKIYREMPGKVLLAVVNHWHVPGIEYHWRHTTGTEAKQEPINPIGDFDINDFLETDLVNDYLRRVKSGNAKTEPAVTSNYLVQYHKQIVEAERERHAFFLGHDDPHLEHSLYNNENKDVKNLPYESGHH